MKITKVYCPACGRCVGELKLKDKMTHKVLVVEPTSSKVQSVYNLKCIKCKKQVYVSTEQ